MCKVSIFVQPFWLIVPLSKLGYELLRVLLALREWGGDFVDYIFHKAYPNELLKHVSPLAAGAFGCYSVLITLPVIYKNS